MIREKKLIVSAMIIAMIFAVCIFPDSVSGATYSGRYWLKVNTQKNVVTAYKRTADGWTPVRAMLCSTGLNNATPLGTFYTPGKWNWGELMNGVYGQYCTVITQDVLFHSVYYSKAGDKAAQLTSEFNKLGTSASHGCIRLSVMDAKWIYYNCKAGTRVTVYNSSKLSSLGKPKAIKVSQSRYTYWDPTDPDPRNPYFIMPRPVINISSKKSVTVVSGHQYTLTNYVHAKDPNTNMNLDSYLKVSKVEKFNVSDGKYVKGTFSTDSIGTYRITYSVNDPYGRSSKKIFKVKVVGEKVELTQDTIKIAR